MISNEIHLPDWVWPGTVDSGPGAANALVWAFSDLVTHVQAKRAATVVSLALRKVGLRSVRASGPVTVVGRHVVVGLTQTLATEDSSAVIEALTGGYESGFGSMLLAGAHPGGQVVAIYRGW